MLSPHTAAAAREAIKRALDGRATVPGDLPYPPSINAYALDSANVAEHSPTGRRVTLAARQIYIAGYLAGRSGDDQIGEQVRQALDIPQSEAKTTYHPHVGAGGLPGVRRRT
jgi:hypothetical protein